MIIRDATGADMEAVRDVYNALIPTSTVTWTETPQTLEERLSWFDLQQNRGHPVLIADEGGSTAGCPK